VITQNRDAACNLVVLGGKCPNQRAVIRSQSRIDDGVLDAIMQFEQRADSLADRLASVSSTSGGIAELTKRAEDDFVLPSQQRRRAVIDAGQIFEGALQVHCGIDLQCSETSACRVPTERSSIQGFCGANCVNTASTWCKTYRRRQRS